MTAKPLRLSPAQWALLRALPDDGPASWYPFLRKERSTIAVLWRAGLVEVAEPRRAWRTAAGRLAVEAEDRRQREEKAVGRALDYMDRMFRGEA